MADKDKAVGRGKGAGTEDDGWLDRVADTVAGAVDYVADKVTSGGQTGKAKKALTTANDDREKAAGSK